ncbi:HAMP domain-containing histidine kinase [bacterium]|nr:HAMP domain-containing histidine kinase [bacterium]
MDDILAVLAHELRTPLQAILTWADVLRRQPLDGRLVLRAAEVVERSTRTEMRAIGDLLDLSRIAGGRLRLERHRVDMLAVVRRALDSARAAAAARPVAVIFDVPAAPCHVQGDADRLQQVVWRLLTNAIERTPANGRVEVALAIEGAQIVLRVRDDGPRIPDSLPPHVLDRLHQADRSAAQGHGGLGLGLTLARHLVELHGGALAAANAVGGGALFTVCLPASPA